MLDFVAAEAEQRFLRQSVDGDDGTDRERVGAQFLNGERVRGIENVISVGDFLFGQQVTALLFDRGFNNRDELAFLAIASDQERFIVRANRPVSEPMTLALLVLGVVAMGLGRTFPT